MAFENLKQLAIKLITKNGTSGFVFSNTVTIDDNFEPQDDHSAYSCKFVVFPLTKSLSIDGQLVNEKLNQIYLIPPLNQIIKKGYIIRSTTSSHSFTIDNIQEIAPNTQDIIVYIIESSIK